MEVCRSLLLHSPVFCALEFVWTNWKTVVFAARFSVHIDSVYIYYCGTQTSIYYIHDQEGDIEWFPLSPLWMHLLSIQYAQCALVIDYIFVPLFIANEHTQ